MLYVRNEHALHVYSRLAEMAVHSSGCVDAGWLAYLALRSEKFLLQWGRDLDSSVTPFEIGRDFRVKFEVRPAPARAPTDCLAYRCTRRCPLHLRVQPVHCSQSALRACALLSTVQYSAPYGSWQYSIQYCTSVQY